MNGDYRRYLMRDMKQIEPNGFSVVSTFSGGGGSCLGYRLAGYKVLYANEFVKEAQDTYRANHPDSYLETKDIRLVTADEILERIGLKRGELDLFDGSPPCSAFSLAGSREKKWGKTAKYSDTEQRVDDLFFEYVRLLKGLQPKVFVAENVKGLVIGTAKGYFKLILQALRDCGYRVTAQVINASRMGVPQARERLIFVGIRNDLDCPDFKIKPVTRQITTGEAFADLVDNELQARELCEAMKSHDRTYPLLRRMSNNLIKNTSLGDYHPKGSRFTHVRLSMFQPSCTIKATADIYHPIEDRLLTIAEVMRLTSIPDDFVLTGGFYEQWERLGRMVPPVMMMNISKQIAQEVLCKIK